jgi:transposase
MAARDAAAGGAGVGLDPAAVRALPLDEYAALLLRLGRYRVDPATGAVVSAHTGRPMAPQRNRETGYLQVQLSFSPVAVRLIAVHRLVAVAAWGAEAVRGRHVVHRDGDRAHNAVANLGLVDPPPRNRHPRPGDPAPAGPPAASCARCGTTGGTVRAPGRPPPRTSGARFGIDGGLCAVCYDGLHRRERRRLARAGGPSATPPAAPPGPQGARPDAGARRAAPDRVGRARAAGEAGRPGGLVRLDEAGRRALLALAAGERRARVARRYRVLLLLGDGQPPEAVAAALGCCRASVYGWAAAWRRAGAAGVRPAAARGGRGRALAGGGEAVLDARLRAAPQAFGHSAAGWTVALLLTELRAAGYAVGPRTVYRTLHRLGWRGTRRTLVRRRPDPAEQAPDTHR